MAVEYASTRKHLMGIPSLGGRRGLVCLVGLTITWAGCSTDGSFSPDRSTTVPVESRQSNRVAGEMLVLLGKAIFNDENLSLRRNQSCAARRAPKGRPR